MAKIGIYWTYTKDLLKNAPKSIAKSEKCRFRLKIQAVLAIRPDNSDKKKPVPRFSGSGN